MRSKRDPGQGQLSAGRKRRGQPHDLLDWWWVDSRLGGRKSDEGRRIWCAGRHHPRDTRRHRWWLAVWVAWHLARRRDHRVHPRGLCRRSDSRVDRAEVEKGVGMFRWMEAALARNLRFSGAGALLFQERACSTMPRGRVFAEREERRSLEVQSRRRERSTADLGDV